MPDLQYPIGRFVEDADVTAEKRQRWMAQIAAAPEALRAAVARLTPEQLDTTYRPGGWTVRQVVHHLADSHVHVFVRFRLALTESEPTIKGYDPPAWAELPDARTGAIEPSLALFEALHQRWLLLLHSMKGEDFARAYRRPDSQVVTLDRALQTYAWHGRHHVAHITTLRERMSWK
jgi:uncharacterized damage-inducible protein DinB